MEVASEINKLEEEETKVSNITRFLEKQVRQRISKEKAEKLKNERKAKRTKRYS